MPNEISWFLVWCWSVNMSLTLFGFLVRKNTFLRTYDLPLDGGKNLPDGFRIIGDSTTFGGILFVCLLGVLGELLWPDHHFFVLALLVKVGDMLGSFIKRRVGVARGEFLPIVDHGDYIIVAGIYMYSLGVLPFIYVFGAWVATLLLTPFITMVAWYLHIRRAPL